MENIIYLFHTISQKKLVKAGAVFCVFLTISYLFILGSVMEQTAQKKKLNITLENESQHLLALEAKTIDKKITLNSFLGRGYVESRSFDVIKTTRNVASILPPHY